MRDSGSIDQDAIVVVLTFIAEVQEEGLDTGMEYNTYFSYVSPSYHQVVVDHLHTCARVSRRNFILSTHHGEVVRLYLARCVMVF